MDTAWTVAIIAGVTLAFNILNSMLGGGWKLSGRITGIETAIGSRLPSIDATLTALQADIKKLSEVLISIAELSGKYEGLSARVTGAEQDIRDLRHGRGFVVHRSDGGVNGEWP